MERSNPDSNTDQTSNLSVCIENKRILFERSHPFYVVYDEIFYNKDDF